jgi:gamma-glutamyl:cysteine ligase YbdK (ATP-grasp superfamily)
MNKQRRTRDLDSIALTMDLCVVDHTTRQAAPLAAWALSRTASPTGEARWTSERREHVLTLSVSKPTKRPFSLAKRMKVEVRTMNALLAERNALLVPLAAHPFSDGATQAHHAGDPANAVLAKLFDLRLPGWSNSQITGLRLPFSNDDEFSRLHASVRLLLPLLPAIGAASPFLRGAPTGIMSARTDACLHHVEALPELIGPVIPEAVFSEEDYYRTVFSPMAQALARGDGGHVLDHFSMNARAAVARFDRGDVELRVMDVQECVSANLALAELTMCVLRAMGSGRWVSPYLQRAWIEDDLYPIFQQTVREGGQAVITNRDYLLMFGLMKQDQMSAQKIWQHLFVELYGDLSDDCRRVLAHILEHGCLAFRMLRKVGRKPSPAALADLVDALGQCLAKDELLP